MVVVIIGFAANAQENITKLTFSPGLIGVKGDTNSLSPTVYTWLFGIAQERKISDRLSIQTAFKFSSKKDLDVNGFTGAEYGDSAYNPFDNASLFTWTNVTELRIYGRDKALKGFYFGPYLNYASNKLESDPDFVSLVDEFDEVFYGDVQQIIGLTNIGLGFQIGTQKVFDGGLVLDWTILGIGFNSYKASLKYDVTNTSGNFDFRNYEKEIEETVLDIESLADVSYDIQKESVEASIKKGFVHFRMSLSIGFGYGGKSSNKNSDSKSF